MGATALLGLVLWLLDGRRHRKEIPSGSDEAGPEDTSAPDTSASADGGGEECCGMHVVCEKTSLSPVSDEIIYYDDEELDRFRGRGASDYDDAETEEWRDILLTLRPAEIAGWARSVQLRGLVMPSLIRDELLMIVAEARENLDKREKNK